MKKIGFDFENVGGLAECYAIPVESFKRIRVDYVRNLRDVEVVDRGSIVVIPMYADDTFQHKEVKQRADGGDYWELDVEGVIPKTCKSNDMLLETLERGRWLLLSRDNNGVVRLSGTPQIPLFCDTERSTGTSYAERNGTVFHFTGINMAMSIYYHEIPHLKKYLLI